MMLGMSLPYVGNFLKCKQLCKRAAIVQTSANSHFRPMGLQEIVPSGSHLSLWSIATNRRD
jgi:hypothetical protein